MNDHPLGLEGRTIVVAGAGGGGIGTAISAAVVSAGAEVIALDIDEERLQSALDLGAAVNGRIADARDVAAVDRALAGLGPLHGLVHVAGGLALDQWERTERISSETFDAVIALNLRAAFVTSQAVAARLIADGDGGAIVHVASIAALSAMPFGAAYAAAKAGVLALMRTQAVEWGARGIRVNAIAPGSVVTPKNAGYETEPAADDSIPLRRRGTTGDIAGAALFLLSDLSSFVTGHTLVVDGGASVRPSFLDDAGLPVFVRDRELRARLAE